MSHPYKAIEPLTFSVFASDWTAHEELLLIEGIFACGLGNWKDVSEFLGTKSEEEVEMHFYDICKLQNDFSQEICKVGIANSENKVEANDVAQNNENATNDSANASQANGACNVDYTANILPDVSNPNFHSISSYMPYRKDFDTEYENDYETVLKEANNDPLFDNGNMQELKDVLFDAYQNVLKTRNQKKHVVLEKKLYDYKNISTSTDENESDIQKNIKCLTQYLSIDDFNTFYKGLCIENFLATMHAKKGAAKEDYLSCEKIRHPLLSDAERKICTKTRITYKEYLRIKNKVIEEKVKNKYMDMKKMRSILGCNNAKTEALYKFFAKNKWI